MNSDKLCTNIMSGGTTKSREEFRLLWQLACSRFAEQFSQPRMLRIEAAQVLRQQGGDAAHDFVGIFLQSLITAFIRCGQGRESESLASADRDVRSPEMLQLGKEDGIE